MTLTEMTSLKLFRQASGILRQHGIEEPEKEVELLFSDLLNIKKEDLYGKDPLVGEEQQLRLLDAVRQRTEGRPLQYITGQVEFYGLKIFVGEGVLIPRPETELIVDEVLLLKKQGHLGDSPRVLDLCTGSGCIALSVAKLIKDATVIGTESSDTALFYAEKNRAYQGLKNVRFICTDLFPEEGVFDLIVSNPPYVSEKDMRGLEPQVLREPREALYGGKDGLDFYRRILSRAPLYLRPGGFMVLEMGIAQAEAVSAMAEQAGFRVFRKTRDLSGVERVIVLRQGTESRV